MQTQYRSEASGQPKVEKHGDSCEGRTRQGNGGCGPQNPRTAPARRGWEDHATGKTKERNVHCDDGESRQASVRKDDQPKVSAKPANKKGRRPDKARGQYEDGQDWSRPRAGQARYGLWSKAARKRGIKASGGRQPVRPTTTGCRRARQTETSKGGGGSSSDGRRTAWTIEKGEDRERKRGP